jgi:hypothetical protein
MRKHIKCRVIQSTPLTESRDSVRDVTMSSKINHPAAFTYSSRLIATHVDDAPIPKALDLYA